jgi:hypothetical protein
LLKIVLEMQIQTNMISTWTVVVVICLQIGCSTIQVNAQACLSDPCANGGICTNLTSAILFGCDSSGPGLANAPSEWYSVDPTVGSASPIGSFVNEDTCGSVAQSPVSGIFYSSGLNLGNTAPGLYQIDSQTGLATLIGAHTDSTLFFNDLKFHPTTAVLYGIAVGNNVPPAARGLYSLNIDTGAETFIGQLSGPTMFTGGGLFFLNNVLYAGLNNQIYSINLATGAASAPLLTMTGSPFTTCLATPRIAAFAILNGVIYGWFNCNNPLIHNQLISLDFNTGVTTAVGAPFPTVRSQGMDGLVTGIVSNGFNCTCAAGFTGMTCEQANACLSQPCQNGGTCTIDPTNSILCSCPTGFGGTFCETSISVCDSNPCNNGGTCAVCP